MLIQKQTDSRALLPRSLWIGSLFLALLAITCLEHACAQSVWDGSEGTSWNVADNWTPSGVPGSGDVALFDGTAANDCLINAPANVAGFDIRGGTVTQGAGATITVGAAGFLQSGGTFNGGSNTITLSVGGGRSVFTQSGGVFTNTTGTFQASSVTMTRTAGIYNHNGGLTRLVGNQNILNMNGGSLFNVDIDHGNPMSYMRFDSAVTIQGNLRLLGCSIVEPGAVVTVSVEGNVETRYIYRNPRAVILRFTGSADQEVRANGGSGAIPSIEIDKPAGGTVTFYDEIRCRAGNGVPLWKLTAGNGAVWAPGSKFVDIGYNTNFNDGLTVFNDVDLRKANPNTTLSVTGTWHVAGEFRISGVRNLSGGTIEVGGDLISTHAPVGGTANIVLNGTADQNINVTAGSQITADPLTINKTSGTAYLVNNLTLGFGGQDIVVAEGILDINGNNLSVNDRIIAEDGGRIRAEGGETVSGTEDFRAGSVIEYYGTGSYTTLLPFGNTYAGLHFNGAGGVWEPNGDVTVSQDLLIEQGTFDIDGNNLNVGGTFENQGTLRMQGDETVVLNGDPDSGTTEYDGNGDGNPDAYVIKDLTYHDLLVNFIDGTDSLTPGAVAAVTAQGTFTLNGGIFNPPPTFTVTELATVSGGSYQGGTSAQTFNAGLTVSGGAFDGGSADIPVTGDVNVLGGAMTSTSGLLTVDGNWNNQATFNHNNGSVRFINANTTLQGSTAFNNLTGDLAGQTFVFEAGTTQTVIGLTTFDGQSTATRTNLMSSVFGSQWFLDPQGPRAIQHVWVQDGNNLTLPIINPPNSLNAGNNVFWFNPVPNAFADDFAAQVDTVLNVAAPGVLGNDVDVDNDPLTAGLVGGPANGTLIFNADGSFTYTPDPGFIGVDTFTYSASDGPSASNVATVTITVRSLIEPNPAVDPTVIALGDLTDLTCAPTGGGGVYTDFSWTGPQGFTSDQQNPGLIKAPLAGFLTYTVTVTDIYGFTGTASVQLAVIESRLEPNPFAQPELIPYGSSTNLSCVPTGGTGVYVAYSWTGPGGFTSNVQNPGEVTPPLPGPATYTVTVTDASGLVASDSVTVIVGTVAVGAKKAIYRVMSASTDDRPLDKVKILLQGVDLEPGDRLIMQVNGVRVGALADEESLTLDKKLRAKGQMGAYPNVFHNCRAKFNAKRRKLIISATRGKVDNGGQAMVMAASGLSPSVYVAVLVDRAPADGIADVAFMAPVVFKVKYRVSASGGAVESGRITKQR